MLCLEEAAGFQLLGHIGGRVVVEAAILEVLRCREQFVVLLRVVIDRSAEITLTQECDDPLVV